MSAEDPSTSHTVPIDDEEPATPRRARRQVYLLVAHPGGIVTVPLAGGAKVVVGREPPAHVVIPDKSLSRSHARFTRAPDSEAVTVEDLGSTNHTKIGGSPVRQATVRPGEEVLLGAIAASVHVVAGNDARPLGLDDHEAFRGALDAELTRARYLRRSLAVLMVRALGSPGEHMVAWAPRVQAAVRPIDRLALYGADVVEILLPEADRDQALALGRRLSPAPGHGATLACGIACFPGAASAEEIVEAALDAMRRATAAQPVQIALGEGHRILGARDLGAESAAVMESPVMREVTRIAARCATAVVPVVIRGETGTGKEVLARLIHEGGPRRGKPLVAVNCAAIPASLLDSILFGHVRGAFSGALQDKKGLFEEADGGTLLLDEIGELPASAQAALLRVLEEARVRRVGDAKEITIDVRVIAATHRDLEAMADDGTFRRDLLFRLNVMEVTLPPLRERRPDIAPLSLRFLAAAAAANGRAVRAIAPEALALLERYPWPGNVRELRNAVERAVVVAEGNTITPLDLPARVRGVGAASPPEEPRTTGSLKSQMEQFEREVLLRALRDGKTQQAAADLLEVRLRTLQLKLQQYKIKQKGGYGTGGEP